MAKNANQSLHKAKAAKQDEFYTQLVDIENELVHYEDYFAGKVVYCNCDDPKVSNFFLYFAKSFWHLKLKKLICSCYRNTDPSHFSLGNSELGCFFEYEGRDFNGKELREGSEIEKFIPTIQSAEFKRSDGDFRSKESIELLKQADVVVTNPPFSLFREFVAQLMEYNKKLVILGNKNAISYKEIFALIKDNNLWVGYTPMGTDLLFDTSESFKKEVLENKKSGSAYRVVDGVIKLRSQSVWFTNLEHSKRNSFLETIHSYAQTPEKYPKYDNYDAINVNKTKEIPLDFDGVMGVPISFLDKYNPKQFDIVGQMVTTKIDEFNFGYPFINGEKIFARVLIKRKI